MSSATRPQRKGTQDALAERVGVHVSHIRRNEAGTSTPTFDVLRNIAPALHVGIVFDHDGRGPDTENSLTFEANTAPDPDDRPRPSSTSSSSATTPAV